MKQGLLRKIVPHLVAILIFLIISVLFCKPALEGNVLNQHDIIGWKGMAQGSFEYKEKTGHFPLWNTNAFSGMPNYMIVMEGKSVLPDLNKIIGLWLPQPMNFFFIACICFYILGLALRTHFLVALLGAVAFGFATYNPIIIAAGHLTKMYAIAYMPLLLAGIILTYEKKYWLGLAVTTLGAYLQIAANHPQISYYFFIVAGAVTIAYLAEWIRKKEWKHAGIALGITAVAAITGLLSSALGFMMTSEYAKATMRGGKTVSIQGDSVTLAKTEGLDTNYAFAYSLAKEEVTTLLMPNAFGGGSKIMLGEGSAVVEKLVNRKVPEVSAVQFAETLPRFWGDPESTAGGPLYSGAIVCLLALIAFVLYKRPLRWALLAVSVLGALMAFGKNLPGFNYFLFENLPLYNKFRAPSMTMVILQLTIPVAAILGLQWLLFRENGQALLKADFKKILFAIGGLTVLLGLMYMSMSYSSPIDRMLLARNGIQPGDEIGSAILSGLREDRKAMFGGQILRTLGFAALLLAALYMYMKKILSAVAVVAILAVITIIDMLVVDSKYLNDSAYVTKEELEQVLIAKTPIDQQILADKDLHFRVYNAGEERFSASDYHYPSFFKTIGGYHAAKLRFYQDIIERYLNYGINEQVINMLNVKYVIVPAPQTGEPTLIPNPGAYGPAWLVKHVKIAKDDVEALQAIGSTNLKDTAIVQQEFSALVTQPVLDSTASITLTKFDNDEVEYSVKSNSPQFAVFSEVYYRYGWNAYLDDKKTDYVRADYTLRGLSVPAGTHTVKFKFEPATFKKSSNIAYISTFLTALLVLGGFFMHWRQNRQKTTAGGK